MQGDTLRSYLIGGKGLYQEQALEAFFEIFKNIQEGILILDTTCLEDIQPIFMNDRFKALLETFEQDTQRSTCATESLQKNLLPLIWGSLNRALTYQSDILQSIDTKAKNTKDNWLCHIIPIKKHLGPIQQTVLLFQAYPTEEPHAEKPSSPEATMGRFVSGMAHDFNNILVIINAYIDILRLKLKNHQELHSYLEIIRNAGTKASDLVEQLMNFCSDSIDTKTVFNLKDSVLEIKKILEYTLSKHSIIHIETDLQDAFIEANPCEIEQILTNLCLNAQQAMPEGGSLKISLEVEPNSPYVCLKVKDEGKGMPETVKEHLFEASFTTKLQKKGHGFGLFNIAAIVKKLEGFIEVDSTIGRGTTFKLFFKQAIARPPQTRTTQAARIPIENKVNVLFIERDEAHQRYFSDLLSSTGYKVLLLGENQNLSNIESHSKVDLVLLGPSHDSLNTNDDTLQCIEYWIQKNPQLKIVCLSQTIEHQKLLKDRYHNRLFCFPHLSHFSQILKLIPPILNMDSMPLG
jgi:signal transduction histidine kinase/CheY-like chemotaxis protein